MKKITIDRSKWRRGGDTQEDAGETCLLNNEGFMCCLGFIALAEGFDEDEILCAGEPSDMKIAWNAEARRMAENLLEFEMDDEEDDGEIPEVLTKEIVEKAIKINDDEHYPPDDLYREQILKGLFRGIYELEFVDGEANEAA